MNGKDRRVEDDVRADEPAGDGSVDRSATGADGDVATDDATTHSIPIEKLGVMNRLGEIGIEGVRDRLEGVNTVEGDVVAERVKSGYVGPDNLEVAFSGSERLGCKVALPGGPYGYALVLFEEESAYAATGPLLSVSEPDLSAVTAELARSALLELCTMLTNGFLDAWADTFGVRIDVGRPIFVRSTERDVVRGVVRGGDDLGVFVTTKLHVTAPDFRVDVYLFPENGTFVEILDRLTIDRVSP